MDDFHRIEFEKPDLALLNRNLTVVDMHFHSNHSDGRNRIPTIAKRLRALDIGVAITDHNEIRGAVEIDRERDILSIPGIEVTSGEGSHLLVYFYLVKELKAFYRDVVKPHMGNDRMSSLSLSMEELLKAAASYRTVRIFAHPYCAAYTGVCNSLFSKTHLKRLMKMVDGVEVINAGNVHKWNLRCAVLGFNLGKMVTGGSDGHQLSHLGKAVSYADCQPERKAFLDSIARKKNKVIGKEIALLRKVTSNGLKLRSNLRNTPDLVEKNLRYSYTVINTKSRTLRDNLQRSLNGRAARRRR